MGRGVAVSLGLIGRNLVLVRRMPSVFLPALVMPLFILIATAGAFHGIGALPAFAGASYIAFTLPMAATMGAGFAGVNSGMTLARDLEYGFFARLQASPAPRLALIAGPIGAAMVRSLFTSTVVFVAATIAGAPWPGLGNALVVYLLAMGFAACAACWATGVALRTKSVQAAPLMQVVVFISVFCSVAYTPRDALTGWLRHVADYNPVTRVLEASRAAELVGTSWATLWPGLVSLGALLAVLLVFSLTGFRRLTSE